MFLLRNFSKINGLIVKAARYNPGKKNRSMPAMLLSNSPVALTARHVYAMADARADNGHRLSLANDS